jgi:hypothetical protein
MLQLFVNPQETEFVEYRYVRLPIAEKLTLQIYEGIAGK